MVLQQMGNSSPEGQLCPVPITMERALVNCVCPVN